MKLSAIPLIISVILAPIAVNAEQISASIDGFGVPDPLLWTVTATDDLDIRISKQANSPGGTNTSTHILIEGLSPVEDGATVYSSSYSGVDVSTGEYQDAGVLYLTMPEGAQLPPETVSSPIVGVVQRAGDWDAYNPSFPATSVGNSSGIADYDGSTIALTLTRDAQQFNAVIAPSYTVLDEDTILLDSFTLTDGGTSYDLSSSTLIRDEDRFVGTLANESLLSVPTAPAPEYDSLFFSLILDNIPDLDFDGIPDISDQEIAGEFTVGQWALTNLWYVYGASPNVGYSPFFGWFYPAGYPVIFQFNSGWMIVISTPAGGSGEFWFYSPSLGFIYTQTGWGGNFYHYDGAWVLNNFFHPNA